MTAPTIVNTYVVNITTVSGGGFTADTAFQPAAGNLLIAYTVSDTSYSCNLTGWTNTAKRSSSTSVSATVSSKNATGEVETIRGTSSNTGGRSFPVFIIEIAGSNGDAGVYAASSVNSSTSSANPNPPSVTLPAQDDYLVLALKSGPAVTTAGPSGYTGYSTPVGSIAFAYTTVNAAVADPPVFTAASAKWVAATVAIRTLQPYTPPARKPIRYSFSF